MLWRHIVLLIAIRPSDGDVKPGDPLGAFREEQAMSRHRVPPSPFLSSSSQTTQLHYTNSYTYSHPNLNFLQHCTDTLPTRNVVCQSGAWFENRPHLTPFIHLACNPKNVIVQWVGIGTHTHTHTHTHIIKDSRKHRELPHEKQYSATVQARLNMIGSSEHVIFSYYYTLLSTCVPSWRKLWSRTTG